MINLKGKRILVTGGASMIGSCVVQALRSREADVYPLLHSECDLLVYDQFIWQLKEFLPDYAVHCAGFNGGLQFNKKYPSLIYGRTARMALNVLEGCKECRVGKVISVLPSCAYSALDELGEPRSVLFEHEFLDGRPHESVECHGFAKRILFEYSLQFYKEFDLNYNCVILNNCYGPRDSFDPNKTKVVGALIKKFVDARRQNLPYVEIFGTGKARREFIYSEDAGEGIVRALESYDNPELPLNIGHGDDIPIKALAIIIREFTSYVGEIKYLGGPDGQLVKLLSNTRMKEWLNWSPSTNLTEGLQKTIKWYEENYA